MKNQQTKESLAVKERQMLPFFVEFVKFATIFACIVMVALLTLNAVSAAMS